MPEHTQPAVFQLAVLVSTDGLVDAEILVVAGQNLGGAPTGMVVKDEVFQQIEEGLFLADAPQHGFQFHAACIAFLQTLPLVEKLVLAAKRAHLGFQSIGQHKKGIIVEQLRNGIKVIPIIVYVGVLHIHGGLFQLDEQQRNAIDKAHNVCPAAVQLRVDLHLFYGEEMIVFRVFEVDHRRASDFGAAIRPLDRHRDAIPQQKILFLIDLHQGCGGNVRREFLLHLVQLVRGEPRVQPQKRLPKIPGQQHFPIAGAAQRPIRPQLFGVVSQHHLPAQNILQQVACTVLDKDIFGVFAAHFLFLLLPTLFLGKNIVLFLFVIMRMQRYNPIAFYEFHIFFPLGKLYLICHFIFIIIRRNKKGLYCSIFVYCCKEHKRMY